MSNRSPRRRGDTLSLADVGLDSVPGVRLDHAEYNADLAKRDGASFHERHRQRHVGPYRVRVVEEPSFM